jgi:hypothetical protein
MSWLVIVDEKLTVLEEYGEFTPQEAKIFFAEALEAISFMRQFPAVVIRNEIQLQMLTDTFARMGLLYGNPDAIQEWMRPYIANELLRQSQRRNLYQRTVEKLSAYRGLWWDRIKAGMFAGASRLFARIINYFTQNK